MSNPSKVDSTNRENTPVSPSPSKLHTYGFAIAIILGVGALAAGACGVAGLFRVGALSQMSQVDAIVTMTVGSGSGILLLVVGIVGRLKNQLKENFPGNTPSSITTENVTAIAPSHSATQTPCFVLGPQEWESLFGVTVETPPSPPDLSSANKDTYIAYIPWTITHRLKSMNFTLSALKEVMGNGLLVDKNIPLDQLNERNYSNGLWISIDFSEARQSSTQNKTFDQQVALVTPKDGSSRMPLVAETLILAVMARKNNVHLSNGIRCWSIDNTPVVFINPTVLNVGLYPNDARERICTVCVKPFIKPQLS